MTWETRAAKDVRVGDVIGHGSPARGTARAAVTPLRVKRIEQLGPDYLHFYCSAFNTFRHPEEGVSVRVDDTGYPPYNEPPTLELMGATYTKTGRINSRGEALYRRVCDDCQEPVRQEPS